MGPKLGLLLVALSICIGSTLGISEGLFFSNGTHILFSEGGSGTPIAVYGQDNSRIVGVAVDSYNAHLFWSDIGYFTKGIFKADIVTDSTGTHLDAVKPIRTDVGEVNGLSVDYSARNVYFTDGSRRTVEVCSYEGFCRTLGTTHHIPRGVVADPRNGLLFWNDQGTGKVERSRLDGSERQILVDTEDVQWPNQMAIQYSSNRLFWVDARTKKVMSSDVSGRNVEDVADLSEEGESNAIFGLALNGNTAFVSVWKSNKILRVTISTGSIAPAFFRLGSDVLFSMAYSSQEEQLKANVESGCVRDNGGCEQLCLPTTGDDYRCACTSYGGLTLNSDGKSCSRPEGDILLYALGEQGEVGFVDLSQPSDRQDKYTVGRSMRPVAVAYDPINQKVYWSDVHERSIHVANLDGTEHKLFLTSNNSLGIVDGMAMDVKGRRLYFSNMDMVEISGATYSWHKIEAIGLDGTGRRTVVETAEKPRGLFINPRERMLYYTDWGSRAAVARVGLDGSGPELLLFPGLQNPNSVAVSDSGSVYVLDSFYKSRKSENRGTFGSEKSGKLFVLENGNVREIAVDVKLPFGLAMRGSELYISDWSRDAIVKYDVSAVGGGEEVILAGVKSLPMALLLTTVSAEEDSESQCDGVGCSDLCFELADDKTACACDSYDSKVLQENNKQCSVSSSNLLIGDLSSLDIRSVGGQDDSTYNLVGGNSFTNIVSLARSGNVVFFSDVNRRNIYRVDIRNGHVELFIELDDIVDGMVINAAQTRLYWTDFYHGKISYADIGTKEVTVLVQGLDKPRAIVLDERNGYEKNVYWTEWGENPRIGRARILDGQFVKTVVGSDILSRPNGLDFDPVTGRLYVGDVGGEGGAYIMECQTGGRDADVECQILPYTYNVPRHIYSVRKVNDQLYYTDWLAGELAMINMNTGRKTSIVKNLMRPTEFLIDNVPTVCPDDHGCQNGCIPHLGGFTCQCPVGEYQVPALPEQDEDSMRCVKSLTGEWVTVSTDLCDVVYATAGVSTIKNRCADMGAECARRIGATDHQCACPPGRWMLDGKCQECEAETYQPYVSVSGACLPCPAPSTAPQKGSTQCLCSGGLSWNYHTRSCQGTKPGECPVDRLPAPKAICNSTLCEQDADCSGAQRCCNAGRGCADGKTVCRDPVNLWECVYQGRLYSIGAVFYPDACVRCSCDADKMFSSNLYGGATCYTANCPTLECPEADQVVPAGKCCPVCGEGSDQQVLRIHNCPQDPVVLALPADASMARLQLLWEVSDTFERKVEDMQELQDPPDSFLPWIGNGETQQLQVVIRAPRSNGDWDTDQCGFQVVVNDDSPPELTCPSDIQLVTAEFPAQVRWTPVQYKDNVCGSSGCEVMSVPAPGAAFSSGSTTVQYTVKDPAGNSAQCSFQVQIQEPASPTCIPPMIYNGYLDCSAMDASDGTKQECEVHCSSGYTVHRTNKLSCKGEDVWNPPITPAFQHFACIRRSEMVVSARMKVKTNVCPTTRLGSLGLSLREGIQDKVSKANADDDSVDISVSVVSSTGCQGGQRKRREAGEEEPELILEVLMESEERALGDRNRTTSLLQSRLSDLKDEGVLCALWPEPDNCGDMEILSAQVTSGCPAGYQLEEDYCFVCPVGTYEMSGRCLMCGSNMFQSVEGQTECSLCPGGMQAPEGSVFTTDCVAAEKATSDLKIPIIIGCVVGGIVLIIIIVAIVCCCRKRDRHVSKMGDPTSYHNRSYSADNVEEARNGFSEYPRKQYESLRDPEDEKAANMEALENSK